jgi:hypothetical protein
VLTPRSSRGGQPNIVDDPMTCVSKTKKAVGAAVGEKASCHSDYVDPDTAQAVHAEKVGAKLVQVNLAPAFNIATDDRVV